MNEREPINRNGEEPVENAGFPLPQPGDLGEAPMNPLALWQEAEQTTERLREEEEARERRRAERDDIFSRARIAENLREPFELIEDTSDAVCELGELHEHITSCLLEIEHGAEIVRRDVASRISIVPLASYEARAALIYLQWCFAYDAPDVALTIGQPWAVVATLPEIVNRASRLVSPRRDTAPSMFFSDVTQEQNIERFPALIAREYYREPRPAYLIGYREDMLRLYMAISEAGRSWCVDILPMLARVVSWRSYMHYVFGSPYTFRMRDGRAGGKLFEGINSGRAITQTAHL